MRINIAKLHVHGAPRRYTVDMKMLRHLRNFEWHYMSKQNRAWAVVRPKKPRVMLHRYILKKAGKNWAESFFDNQDPFDCRLGNLRPYNRNEDGARRRAFKNNKSGYKGVHFKKSNQSNQWGASIRVKGKLQHLGYFPTAEIAAEEYRKAFKLAHPNL